MGKKINIVDVIVIIMLIVIAFGLFIKFKPSGTNEMAANHKTIDYTVKIDGVRNYTINALEQTTAVYRAKTNDYMGEIVNISYEPYRAVKVIEETAEQQLVPVQDKYTVYITIQTEGREADMMYLDSSGTEIYIGGNVDWFTKWVNIYSSQIVGYEIIS
ncbi:MAG: hypothetical protein BEN19_07645 [Epulopiscium sp. Nuni2H_MBin003]|nr:MAG: hypothetical protein BEN19_07645 [Epulopiscium sp. Nuni2H_MBin003]